MKKSLTSIALILLSTFALPASADSHYEPAPGLNTLKRLERSVSKLVKKYYPEATSNSFKDTVHFEHDTRLFISDALVKIPAGKKVPKSVVRGPRAGGVWCDLSFVNRVKPPYQRKEGPLDRKEFIEHRYYPEDTAGKGHLIVTLRLPKNPGEREKKFVAELRKHLESQHDFIERQTELPAGFKILPVEAEKFRETPGSIEKK